MLKGWVNRLFIPVSKKIFDSKPTHFDTNHHLTVLWDKQAPEQAGDKLKATIRATLPQLAKLED